MEGKQWGEGCRALLGFNTHGKFILVYFHLTEESWRRWITWLPFRPLPLVPVELGY